MDVRIEIQSYVFLRPAQETISGDRRGFCKNYTVTNGRSPDKISSVGGFTTKSERGFPISVQCV